MLGDKIEVAPDLGNRFRVEGKSALAAGSNAAHDSCTLQHAEVFGDGLPGQPRPLGQLRDRTGLPARKLGDKSQARLIAEGGKDSRIATPCGTRSRSLSQDRPQCFSLARPSRPHFCEMPQDGDPQGAGQSQTPSPSAACHWRFSPAGIPQACLAPGSNPPEYRFFQETWDAAR